MNRRISSIEVKNGKTGKIKAKFRDWEIKRSAGLIVKKLNQDIKKSLSIVI